MHQDTLGQTLRAPCSVVVHLVGGKLWTPWAPRVLWIERNSVLLAPSFRVVSSFGTTKVGLASFINLTA